MHHSNLTSFNHTNLDGQHATRVRLTQNNSTLAKQKSNQNLIPLNFKFYSQQASRVRLTQNQLTPAQHNNTLKTNPPNHTISDWDPDPRVRFTQNKLTTAGHNPHTHT